MTRYSVDTRRNELLAVWDTAQGEAAITVAKLPERAAPADRAALAVRLTLLSASLWRCYAHPRTAADVMDPTAEGQRHRRSRYPFASVIAAVRGTHAHDAREEIPSRHPVEAAANSVGRALLELASAKLTSAVADDVGAELDAVTRASMGDLSGRARQAILLTREVASPNQVEAADRILSDDPLGGDELFYDVDSTAAAVAAAHWLSAAAHVAAERSGIPINRVVSESDRIESLNHALPTMILEWMESDVRPYDAVTSVVREAMRAAEATLPHPGDPSSALHDREVNGGSLEVRLAPLPPERPAADLLDDLLSAIRGCWLVYRAYTPNSDSDQMNGGEALARTFCREVRTRAHACRHRLL